MDDVCLVCGSRLTGDRIDYPHDTDKKSAELSFDRIERCPRCGLGMALPHVGQAELDRFYASGSYWDDVVRENPFQAAHEENQSGIRVRICLPELKGLEQVRVLEIGAGHAYTVGWLKHYLGDRFHRYDFVEHDEERATRIETENSIACRCTSLEDCSGGYDLILMNHVLEHVAAPVEFMAEVKKRLSSHGIIHVETPHADYRYKQDVFPHTLFFTERAYGALEDRLGLERVCCESFGRPVKESVGGKFTVKLLGQLFKLAVWAGVVPLRRWLDKLLWQYDRSTGDRIWLRWIARTTGRT